MRHVRFALCLLVGLLAAALVLAPRSAEAQRPAAVTVPAEGGDVTVIADHMEEIGPDNLLIATGNVELTRGTARLIADRVEINRETGATVATGRVVFYDGEDRLTGERIDYNVNTGSGVVHEGRAESAPYYHIGGERMERLNPSVYRVRRGIFTTCEDDPPAWSIRFRDATADLESYLFGQNASFWVKNVPIIPFIPFFAAALRRERQSGFLFPRVGSSSRKGMFAEIPFYWAISDSQDATITLDLYENRGVGANLEYRYFLSAENRGTLTGFFLKELWRDEATQAGHDDNRGWGSLLHEWIIAPGLVFRADVNRVTDDFVFREYGDPLGERAAQRVESNLFLTKSWASWNLVTNVFSYQDLSSRQPVELMRLPDIRLQGFRQPLPGDTGILYELEASAVNFVRDLGSDGQRIDVRPRLARPVSVFGFFTVTPFIGARMTGYSTRVTDLRVENEVTIEDTDDEPFLRRATDIGADFEARAARIFDVGGRLGIDAVLHSVEPRVSYVWIEGSHIARYTDQGSIRTGRVPQWDSLDVLRESSAFVYSLTNRLRARTVAPEGTEPVRWEVARLTIGHSYEMLNPDRPMGDITADLVVDSGRGLGLRASSSLGAYGEGIKTVNTDVILNVPRVYASVGTRLAREPVADIEGRVETRTRVSFLQAEIRADLLPNLTGRMITNMDLRTNVLVENRVAFDFKWQCWGLTVEYVSRHDDEDELRFAVNLLGIGTSIGTGASLGALGGASR